jgi:hypothetical protein
MTDPTIPAGHRDGAAGGARESRVSRICKELDEVVEPFRHRPLEGQYPLVWLDALYLKVRHNHRIVSQALAIAPGVRESGERKVLRFALGASEEEAFWLDFLSEGHTCPRVPAAQCRQSAHLPSRQDTGTVWRAVPGGTGPGRCAEPCPPWAQGGTVGHQRRPRRPEEGIGAGPGRGQLAALPGGDPGPLQSRDHHPHWPNRQGSPGPRLLDQEGEEENGEGHGHVASIGIRRLSSESGGSDEQSCRPGRQDDAQHGSQQPPDQPEGQTGHHMQGRTESPRSAHTESGVGGCRQEGDHQEPRPLGFVHRTLLDDLRCRPHFCLAGDVNLEDGVFSADPPAADRGRVPRQQRRIFARQGCHRNCTVHSKDRDPQRTVSADDRMAEGERRKYLLTVQKRHHEAYCRVRTRPLNEAQVATQM